MFPLVLNRPVHLEKWDGKSREKKWKWIIWILKNNIQNIFDKKWEEKFGYREGFGKFSLLKSLPKFSII